MWAVIPVKNFESAKTRLSPLLSLDERIELSKCMMRDVLAALVDARSFKNIVLVTKDSEAMRIASEYGAWLFEEPSSDGYSKAVIRAARWLEARDAEGLVHAPADIPAATGSDFAEILNLHRSSGGTARFTIAPSHDLRGSNCIACTPPNAIQFQFGHDSYRRHLVNAKAAGLACKTMERPGLALDIDSPHDLARFLSLSPATLTLRYLRESGLSSRVLEYVNQSPEKGRTTC